MLRRRFDLQRGGIPLVFSAAALALSLTACGSDDESPASAGQDAGTGDADVQDASTQDTGDADSQPDVGNEEAGKQEGGVEDASADAPEDAVPDAPVEDAEPQDASSEEAGGDGAVVDASPFLVELWVAGDVSPKSFSDGYQGQTPKSFSMGISRFELLESADDSTPALVFDHGASYLEVDMLAETLVGYADLQSIPVGVYSHGRVKLEMVRLEVATYLHPDLSPIPVDGDLTILGALSDVTIDGTPRSKGWAEYTFSFYTTPFSQQATLPSFPSTGAGTIEETTDATYLVFEFDSPLPVAAIPGISFKATLTVDEYESFRWEDLATPGYAAGKFDTEQSGTSEPVRNIGATGYHITVETQ